MPETSMPPPPKHQGSGAFIGAVIVMLLLMGGLLWWNFRPKPEEPKANLPPPPTAPPRTDEEAPPPPPPIEPDAGKKVEAPVKKKVASTGGGGGGCAATCNGSAGAPLQGALSGAAGSVRACYEKALIQNQMLQGKMIVAVKIGPTGSVCNANIQSDTLGDGRVASCVLNRFRGGSFPPPSGGCADVRVPISFTPKK